MRIRTGLLSSFCSVLLLLACGCGGSGGSSNVAPGLWDFQTQSGPITFGAGGSVNVSGNAVSGIMHVTSPNCVSPDKNVSLSGRISNAINLNLSLPNGQTVSFTNLTHPGGHPAALLGNYSISAGGCIPASQGSVDGAAVDVSAIWAGDLGAPSSGQMIQLVLQQTGPDANGFFSSTGTATMTGGTCFSAGMVEPANTRILGHGSKVTLISSNPPGGTMVINGDFLFSGILFPSFGGTYTMSLGTCSQSGSISLS
jgi:hypothetical protein